MNKAEMIAKMVAERQANSHFVFDENDYKLGLSDMYDYLTTKPDEPEPELKFKYEDKLRELGVYDEFVECFKNDELNRDVKDSLDYLNSKETFYKFVIASFNFSKTPQKHKFWSKIANS